MNKTRKLLLLTGLITIFLFSSSLLLYSQAGQGRARLSGKVKVPQGHPVANAQVTLQYAQNEEVTRQTTTNKNGKWVITGLGSGYWRVIVKAEGYVPTQKTVNVSQFNIKASVNIVLKKREQLVEKAPFS